MAPRSTPSSRAIPRSGNVLLGGGGWNGLRHGVQIGSPSPTSNFPDAFTNVTMTDNVMRGALRASLFITRKNVKVTLRNNTVDGPANQGIWVTSQVTGTGSRRCPRPSSR